MALFTDRLALLIEADATKAVAGFRQVETAAKGSLGKTEQQAAQSGKTVGTTYGNAMATSFAAVAGAAVSIGAASFLKSSFDASVEAARAQAQLQAVLKSTGGEAGITAEHVNKLSQSLSDQAAVEDDVVKRGGALLLTFRSVRNEVGAGNDVFDQALTSTLDVSAALGQDLQQSIIQVGKALNDPIRGMTALRRVGVSFTDEQSKQIKVLAETGDLLGAQKIILEELKGEFGGTAKAIADADPFQRLGQSVHEFKQQIGTDVAPAITEIVDAFSGMLKVFEDLPGPVRAVAEGLLAIGVIAGPVLTVNAALTVFRGVLASTAVAETETAVATGVLTGAFGLLAAATAGVALGVVAGNKINDALAGAQPKAEDLATSLSNLGKSGSLSGEALDLVGASGKKLAGDLETIQGNTFQKAFGFAPSAHRAVEDIESVNDGLKKLADTEGPTVAAQAVSRLANAVASSGGDIEEFNKQIDPAIRHINDLADHAAEAKPKVDDLASSFSGLNSALDDISAVLSIADLGDSVSSAVKKLADDKADLAGTSDKATEAAKAEAEAIKGVGQADQSLAAAHDKVSDAYRSLKDAQDQVTESTHDLQRAQEDLDEFNSARGARERALKEDIIQRRVVTTPAELEQKQLDLLQLEDENAKKKEDLQDRVANAQKSVQKALEGVGKATRGIADAEDGVRSATDQVTAAQDRVAEAAKKRRAVHDEAATAIAADERKVQEAVIKVIESIQKAAEDGTLQGQALTDQITFWGTLLHGVADQYAPNSELSKNINNFFSHLVTLQNLTKEGGIAREQGLAGIAHQQAVLRGDKDVLNFATGGIVPGPRGVPRFAVIHGGEEVLTPEQRARGGVAISQTNHFHGSDAPSIADLDYANRALGWRLSHTGRY